MVLYERVSGIFGFVILLVFTTGCQGSILSQPAQKFSGEPAPVSVTRTVSEEIVPSPTPFTCDSLPKGMTLKLIPLSPILVQIELQGLQPGEKITTVFRAEVPGHNKIIENPDIVVGSDGHYTSQEILRPISESNENRWEVAVIHSRGVVCAEVTLPSGQN